MSLSPGILLTVGLPIALAVIIGGVLMSGQMPARLRTGVERVLAVLIYPATALFVGWRAFENWKDGEWLGCVVGLAVVGIMLALGLRAVRQGRLAPVGKAGE